MLCFDVRSIITRRDVNWGDCRTLGVGRAAAHPRRGRARAADPALPAGVAAAARARCVTCRTDHHTLLWKKRR
jgi:hypothetical protein